MASVADFRADLTAFIALFVPTWVHVPESDILRDVFRPPESPVHQDDFFYQLRVYPLGPPPDDIVDSNELPQRVKAEIDLMQNGTSGVQSLPGRFLGDSVFFWGFGMDQAFLFLRTQLFDLSLSTVQDVAEKWQVTDTRREGSVLLIAMETELLLVPG